MIDRTLYGRRKERYILDKKDNKSDLKEVNSFGSITVNVVIVSTSTLLMLYPLDETSINYLCSKDYYLN